MLDVLVYSMMVLYLCSVLFVLFHSILDAHLIFLYLRYFRKKNKSVYHEQLAPFVTIQLPVYNEMHVVERLLDAVIAIDYPHHKMEIQVLDDSTDETSAIIARKLLQLTTLNICIQHIQRPNREGFKAGALKHGLSLAKGEFLAIFDADFIPAKDFLKQTVPFFENKSIGMVQTKWGHLNQDSFLSRLQAMALDGHFSIEQKARNAAGYFMNFNGTAGVWRKQTILEGGNWQADTLTEDFDLSYRAQMKGWEFIYLEEVSTPAELPPLMSAFKSQQFRWTKGGAETARKNIAPLFTSALPLSVKLHGLFHLVYSSGFISIVLYALLSVPLLFVRESYPQFQLIFQWSGLIAFSLLVYILHYFISYFNHNKGSVVRRIVGFIIHFPFFVSLFIGMSLSNAIGIVEGYLGFKSGFVRTPKFNTLVATTQLLKSKYARVRLNWVTYVEGALIFYFGFGIWQAMVFKNYGNLPVLGMAFIGFLMVFGLSITETRKKMAGHA